MPALVGSPLATRIRAPTGKPAGAGPQCVTGGLSAGAAWAWIPGATESRRHVERPRARIKPPKGVRERRHDVAHRRRRQARCRRGALLAPLRVTPEELLCLCLVTVSCG